MNYYYLISSLPELSPTMDTSKLDFDELFDAIKRNLDETDIQTFKYLIYPNDLHNLLTTLSKHYLNWSSIGYKLPSIIEIEDVEAFKKNRRNFPDFMNDFLAENEDRLRGMSRKEMEDAMQHRFYNQITELKNSFLSNYFNFYRKLKSIIAAYNFNTYDFLSKPNISDAERLLLQIGPESTASTSLLKDYPIVEDLIQVLTEKKPIDIEHYIDELMWNFLEDSYTDQFSNIAVFAYTLKLQILKRWHDIKLATNVDYETLINQIINDNSSKKTPVL